MLQFLDDRKFYVMNLTKLWVFLPKYHTLQLTTYTKMVLFLCSIQLYNQYINSKNDVINNYYSIVI